MAVETAPSPAPATPRQLDTITRMARASGQSIATDGLTRAQASAIISDLIAQMSGVDDDDAPTPAVSAPAPAAPVAQAPEEAPRRRGRPPKQQEAPAAQQPQGEWPQPSARELAAQERERELARQTIARGQAQQPASEDDDLDGEGTDEGAAQTVVTTQNEWPRVPAQSSEAQPQNRAPAPRETVTLTTQNVGDVFTVLGAPAAQADDPFGAGADDDLGLRTLGEEDDDEIELARQKDAPEGGPFAFQIISADSVPAGPSGYKGIRIRARGLPIANETGQSAENGIVEDLLSLSPKARFRLDPFLDAIHAPENGSIKRSSFVGKTFWAKTERQTRTWQDATTNEERSATSTRVKEYLQGPPIEAPALNGAAPRQKVQAKLGAEFDTESVPF